MSSAPTPTLASFSDTALRDAAYLADHPVRRLDAQRQQGAGGNPCARTLLVEVHGEALRSSASTKSSVSVPVKSSTRIRASLRARMATRRRRPSITVKSSVFTNTAGQSLPVQTSRANWSASIDGWRKDRQDRVTLSVIGGSPDPFPVCAVTDWIRPRLGDSKRLPNSHAGSPDFNIVWHGKLVVLFSL